MTALYATKSLVWHAGRHDGTSMKRMPPTYKMPTAIMIDDTENREDVDRPSSVDLLT